MIPRLIFLISFVLFARASAEEALLHECGVAFVRLRKPLTHYIDKYQDPAWGRKKLLFSHGKTEE